MAKKVSKSTIEVLRLHVLPLLPSIRKIDESNFPEVTEALEAYIGGLVNDFEKRHLPLEAELKKADLADDELCPEDEKDAPDFADLNQRLGFEKNS